MKAEHYLRALGFPTLAWVIMYFLIVVTIKLFPNQLMVLEGVAIGTGFLVLVAWSLGAWAGYSIVQFGGKFIDVMLVSAIMAMLAGVLQLIIVGVLVSFPAAVNVNAELPVAVFNLITTLAGALTAGGFALTK